MVPPQMPCHAQGGHMPLHFAALQGHVEVLRALLACPGVDCNTADGLGMTPLHHAAVNGQEAACTELLSHGARVDPKISVRLRPASSDNPHELGIWAACWMHALGWMLAGGDTDVLDAQNGASPLHLAAYKGRAAVVKLLIGRGANFRVLLPMLQGTHHIDP